MQVAAQLVDLPHVARHEGGALRLGEVEPLERGRGVGVEARP
jgi:hypothetical protein